MRCLLLYDIPNDRARTRVADACLDYGLERIQWSVFVGELNHIHQRELLLKIRERLRGQAAKVLLQPLSESQWREQRLIAQGDPDGERSE